MLRYSAVSLLFVCAPAIGLACTSDDIVAQAKALANEDREFEAINLIELNLNECYHPLMRLELGELYESVGYDDKAIEQWQISLAEDSLPDNVARKVKLRVIQTSVQPNTNSSGHLLLQAGADYSSNIGTTGNLSATAVGQMRGRSQDFFGYSATPGFYGQFSALNRQYFAEDRSANLLLVEVGGFYQAPIFRTSGGVKLLSTDNTEFAAVGELRLGPRSVQLISDIDWRLNLYELTFAEALRLQAGRTRFTAQVQWLSDANDTLLNEASIELKGLGRNRPSIKSTYNFADEATEIDAKLRIPINPDLWLTAHAGAAYANQVDWNTALSLTWKPL